MPDQSDVRRIALALPETSESTDRFAFSVAHRGKQRAFAWVWLERDDPKRPRVPQPKVLGVRVASEDEKFELVAADPAVYFTEAHYNGFPAVLVRLDAVSMGELEELLIDAWRIQAPKSLVAEYDSGQRT